MLVVGLSGGVRVHWQSSLDLDFVIAGNNTGLILLTVAELVGDALSAPSKAAAVVAAKLSQRHQVGGYM